MAVAPLVGMLCVRAGFPRIVLSYTLLPQQKNPLLLSAPSGRSAQSSSQGDPMISSKGVIALGLAIICCLFLLACGGSSSKPAPTGSPVITTTTLPNPVFGIGYYTTLQATGGT